MANTLSLNSEVGLPTLKTYHCGINLIKITERARKVERNNGKDKKFGRIFTWQQGQVA